MTDLDCIPKIRERHLVNFRDTCLSNGASLIPVFAILANIVFAGNFGIYSPRG